MSLPGGYTELEYIQSSGTQYVDTGLNPNQDFGVTIDFQMTTVSGWQCIFGAANSAQNADEYGVWHNSTNFGFYYASTNVTVSAEATARHLFVCSKNSIAVDGAAASSPAYTSFQTNYPLLLGAINYAGSKMYGSQIKIYSAKIYQNGSLVREFIPCKNAAGVIGLWDDVNSVFYQNAGSGVFTAGPEVRGTHKTLIGGTAYEVKSGKCLINGTAYAIQKGRTLINGTGYDIALASLYDPVFANNEWADIIAACHAGAVPDTWAVGDYKDMTIDGLSYRVDIIGKNHDAYLDGTAAPLTFQLHDCYKTKYSMQVPVSNQRYWENCQMRKTHLPAILKLLPDEIQTGIRAANKTTYGMRATDKLFLLSESEVFGSNQYSADGEGAQYAYYAAGNSRIKKVNGSAYDWWLRSPCIEDVDSYCIVSSGGYRSYKASNYSVGVSFAFCF